MKSIRTKLLAFLTVVLVLTGVLTTMIWYQDMQGMITRYQSNFAQSLTKNAYNSFSYVVDDSVYLLSLVSTNHDNIIGPLTGAPADSLARLGRDRTVNRFIYSLYGYRYFVSGLEVFTLDGSVYKVGEAAADQQALSAQTKLYFTGANRPHIVVLAPTASDNALEKPNRLVPIVQKIEDDRMRPVGYAVVYLDYRVIIQMFTSTLPNGSSLLIRDGHNNTVFNNFSRPAPVLAAGGQPQYFRDGNIYESSYAAESDWHFQIGIPTRQLMGKIYSTMRDTFLLYLVLYVLAMAALALFVVRITNRIATLRHGMREIAQGNLDYRVEVKGRDELSDMGGTYNKMAVQITELLRIVQEEEKKKSEAELDFLQAQINPHFLSNVLNTVVWMANIQNATNISSLTTSLITMLHGTMHRGRRLISLQEELEYIKSYVEIEQCCNFDNFTATYEIEDGVTKLQVLRFIMQPLLENAIKHGIAPLEDRLGQIWIRCRTEEGRLLIQIQDNGVGMTKREIGMLLAGKKEKTGRSFSSIGVKNVDDRIRLFFGREYGLSYESEPNQFTEATVRLPIVRDGDAWEEKWHENKNHRD